MKILMISFDNILEPLVTGIFKKVFGQAEALVEYCNDVDLIYMRDNSIMVYNISNNCLKSVKPHSRKDIYQKIFKIIKEKDYDALYIRYPRSNYNFIHLLHEVKRELKSIRIIVEIPTYPYDQEIKNEKIVYYADRLFRKIIFRYVDFCVCYNKFKKILNIPAVYIENGINLKNIPIRQDHHFKENELHLMGVASITFWQGFDRVIEGLKIYYNKQKNPPVKVYFDILGIGDEMAKLKKLSEDYSIQQYVRFHGFKEKDELTAFFDNCDLGIGAIGMHRRNHVDGSPLKSREYCARGIPFVLATKDRDFSNGFSYVYKVPADDSPVDIEKLISFANEVYKNPNYLSEMREYAENRLTWKVKMKPVIERLNQLMVKDAASIKKREA